MLSLVIIVALLSGHPPEPAPNTANDAVNLVANDVDNATNTADVDTNAPSNVTADSNAVFDPSGPNPLVANNPIPACSTRRR